ncbi:MAG: hypothetical protein ACO1SX_22250 [Actinomycetota bacterium]
MSLDVYLMQPGRVIEAPVERIYIRENGARREISREEWEARWPGTEPVTVTEAEGECVYSANITHNLNRMADAAGVYRHLWRPEEVGATHARDLIDPLAAGVNLLHAEPERFRALNPDNGWGNYEGLVEFAEEYLAACREYPDAELRVSR